MQDQLVICLAGLAVVPFVFVTDSALMDARASRVSRIWRGVFSAAIGAAIVAGIGVSVWRAV